MSDYPFTLTEIESWCRSKGSTLLSSDARLVDIRQRTEYVPGVAADFDATNAMGRINGWVSGEFDFEAVRVSDGKDAFWRHVKVDSLDELERPYADFIQHLINPNS